MNKQLDQKISSYKDELVKDVQELIRIKSVEGEPCEGKPFGEGPAEALDKALEISKRLGFKTGTVDGYAGYAEFGEGDDYVAILGHLDVVPEGDGWNYAPYGAEIHDGKLYGRGAVDDKGPIMAALYGAKAIMDLNLPITKRVRVIFGTNEETGSHDMEYYVKKEKAPVSGFTPDAEFPVIFAEKGITTFNLTKKCNGSLGDYEVEYIKGGIRPNMVPDYCEAEVKGNDLEKIKEKAENLAKKIGFKFECALDDAKIKIKCFGHGAHGSTPEKGKNAVMAMSQLLEDMSTEDTDLSKYLKFINKNIAFDTKGTGLGCNLSDEPSGDLSFNAGMLNFDGKNIILVNNLRYPVTFAIDDILNPVKKSVKDTGIEIEVVDNTKPLYYEKDNPMVAKLQNVFNEITGTSIDPVAIGGGTYAKEVKNIVAFGPVFEDDPDVMHQPNEFIDLDKLMLCAKIYGNAIYELAK